MINSFKWKSPTATALTTILSEEIRKNPQLTWKSIPQIIFTLNHISDLVYNNKGKCVSMSKNFLENHLGQHYRKYINILIQTDLLKVNESYMSPKILNDGTKIEGWCKEYITTEKCLSLLEEEDTIYIHHLNTVEGKRKLQKYFSKHKKEIYNIDYSNLPMNHIYKSNINSYIPEGTFYGANRNLPLTKRRHNQRLYLTLLVKNIHELKKGVDGRISHPLINISSTVRKHYIINDKPIQMIIDIVSCHPQLFYFLIKDLSETIGMDHIIKKEMEEYRKIFLSETVDCKKYLCNKLGYDREVIKDIMCKYFNGCGYEYGYTEDSKYYKYEQFMLNTFPLIMKVWRSIDRSVTGTMISKNYETKLFLSQDIFRFAESKGVEMLYSYDGCDLYSHNKESCKEVLKFIKEKSLELFNTVLIFKIEEGEDIFTEIDYTCDLMDKELNPIVIEKIYSTI